MKPIVTLLILFTLFSFNTYAQDYTQLGLPEGAKARLGKGSIRAITYSPDGTRLAVAGSLGIWLYDTATHKEVALFTGHTREVTSVAFSPDGATIASGSRDNTVRLWDAVTGQPKTTLTGHTRQVVSVAYSPDGATIASGGGYNDQTVRLWDAVTGQPKATLMGHTGRVTSVAFSPDGNTLASGSFQEVRLWDVVTGQPKATLTGHTDNVSSVAFSPDGATIASGWGFGEIRLWDAVTGQHQTTLRGHTYWVSSVAFSPDGATLATGSADGTVLLWEFTSPEPTHPKGDVNRDGVVDISDLVHVIANLDKTAPNDADVNGDGLVDISDMIAVAGAIIDNAAAAPAAQTKALSMLNPDDVQRWLTQARRLNLTDPHWQRGIRFLEQLLAALTPKATALLPNYPNPFNPETWIPYRLAHAADVTLTIYDIKGVVVRQLELGHQVAGYYTARSKAAYWDSCNESGESVANGVYFYGNYIQ